MRYFEQILSDQVRIRNLKYQRFAPSGCKDVGLWQKLNSFEEKMVREAYLLLLNSLNKVEKNDEVRSGQVFKICIWRKTLFFSQLCDFTSICGFL